eukprot:scaffold2.g7110.t1
MARVVASMLKLGSIRQTGSLAVPGWRVDARAATAALGAALPRAAPPARRAWSSPQRQAARRLAVNAAASAGNGAGVDEGPYDYDLFCIGAGSGGVRAARVAAGTYGAKVGICELPFNPIASDEAGGAGGTCVLRGCVPKKLFVEYSEAFKDAQGYGWRLPGAPALDWPAFLAKKNEELRRLNGVYMGLLKNSGVDYIEGRGRLLDAHTVEVAGRRVTARHVLVATGARAFVPAFPGAEHCIISDNALEISEASSNDRPMGFVPKSIAVVGSGYIAVEFASIFAGLGSEVHLIFRQPLPLRGFDAEVRKFAAEQYVQNGIALHAQHVPASIERAPSGRLRFAAAHTATGEQVVLEVDHVLAATGRNPNVRGLGLEAAGVALNEKGAIQVDAYSQTSAPSVWAVGDVTDRLNLTPVALMEAMALTKTLFGGEPTAPDHADVATAVFSHPQIGTVGLTEEQAVARHGDVDVYTSSFRPMRNTISGNHGRTLMKLVVAGASGRVVGVHMVGPDSAEIMQGMGVAVKLGVTKAQLDSVVGIHPSAAEEFVTMRTPTRQVRQAAAAAVAGAA